MDSDELETFRTPSLGSSPEPCPVISDYKHEHPVASSNAVVVVVVQARNGRPEEETESVGRGNNKPINDGEPRLKRRIS